MNKHIAVAEPLYRGGGSIGIVGAARCALIVGRDPDDATGITRILAQSKNDLGSASPSLAYGLLENRRIKVIVSAPQRRMDARHELGITRQFDGVRYHYSRYEWRRQQADFHR